MPSLPPDSLSICELIPTTRPSPSSSGPPELPWLIAASVWIAPAIAKSFGAVISRSRALTTPVVSVCSSPYGLPIATTASPTARSPESPSASGRSFSGETSTSSTATSVDASEPTSVACAFEPSQNVTVIDSAPSTTCWFVTIVPSSSYTNPEPCPWASCPPNGVAAVPPTLTSTTPLYERS